VHNGPIEIESNDADGHEDEQRPDESEFNGGSTSFEVANRQAYFMLRAWMETLANWFARRSDPVTPQ
jgi:hypothetical protein